MKTSEKGINLIKSFEGFSSTPYLDIAKIPTIGYGFTHYLDGTKVKLSDKAISLEQAENILKLSLRNYENVINENVKVQLNQNQFDALASFVYNVGGTAFKNSTLLKKLNQVDYLGAAEEFLRWNKAGGAENKGLTRRREAEKALFLA